MVPRGCNEERGRLVEEGRLGERRPEGMEWDSERVRW